MIDIVMFSKDRACQLEACLRSISVMVRVPVNVWVLRASSSLPFLEGYLRLEEIDFGFPVNWMAESDSFRDDVRNLLFEGTEALVMLMVDDAIFTRELEADAPMKKLLSDEFVLAYVLRFGRNIRMVSPYISYGHMGYCAWSWVRSKGKRGLSYPMAVEGNIYRRDDIVPYLAKLQFSCPNEMEEVMMADPIKKPKMVCSQYSKIVHLAMNKVQTWNDNKGGEHDPSMLNDRWLKGERLKIDKAFGMFNRVCHLPWEPEFEPVV